MKISIVGTGYVGLVTGACFSEFGMDVTCIDNDKSKIDQLNNGKMPIYEPGLETLVQNNINSKRLSFTIDINQGIKDAEIIFIAVGTPSRRGDGHADLSYIFEAIKEIGNVINSYTVIATKSTVPVGTGKKIYHILKKQYPNKNFDIVSNPEFLREGSAITDFMKPDRVIIGTKTEKSKNLMRCLYRPLHLIETPILFTDIETAELIKYASNSFLATKITFINEMSNLCEKVGANIQDLSKGMGLDNRIGKNFLHVGPGYGGSCFPKDCLALIQTAKENNINLSIVESTINANDHRKLNMADRIIHYCEGVKNKKITILGLTFKPNTDDIRDSPSIPIIEKLISENANIYVFDPKGMEEFRKLYPSINYCNDAYEAISNSEALIFLTEWNEFRALDLVKIKILLKNPLIIDLRNIYSLKEMKQYGFDYKSLGRVR